MSDDEDELRRFVRRAMGAAVPPREVESRALAAIVLRSRGPAAVVGDGAREAAAMVAAAAQELSPASAAVVAGAAAPSLVKIVIAVVVAGAAGTLAWRSAKDTRTAESPPTVAVAPSAPAIVAMPIPAEPPPTSAPIVAPAPTEAAPSEDELTMPRRSRAKPATPPAMVEDTLVAETELVAAADRALARGEAEEALALTADHARRFADGQLVLERRAIELSARCVLHRAGAQDDAAAFLRTHADTSAAAKVRARCPSDDSGRAR